MKFLARGAEAELYKCRFHGRAVAEKIRGKKDYRINEIDLPLRRSRTRGEATLLHSAKEAGVACPTIYEVGEFELKLSFVDGVMLRDLVKKNRAERLGGTLKEVGTGLARLHEADIVHGDFTTANVMVGGGRVFFIDFGLGGFSKDAEEKALDVLLMKKSLDNQKAYGLFLSGYKSYKGFSQVMLQLAEIEKRGRYVVRSWAGA